jgi:hypothetical protein
MMPNHNFLEPSPPFIFMKTTLTIILSGLLLCGCSQKPATVARPAIDLVESGKDIAWHDGFILRVAKRDGMAIQGVQITGTTPDGQKVVVTAETGALSPGSVENAADDGSVRITLKNAAIEQRSKTGKTITNARDVTYVLHE